MNPEFEDLPPVEQLREQYRGWTTDQLRTALPQFDRYHRVQLDLMREELNRRTGIALPPSPVKDVRCPHCQIPLKFAGTKKFHEGTRWGLLGDLGELFVNKEQFDVYFCPRCGKVEFYVDGIGESMRPQ